MTGWWVPLGSFGSSLLIRIHVLMVLLGFWHRSFQLECILLWRSQLLDTWHTLDMLLTYSRACWWGTWHSNVGALATEHLKAWDKKSSEYRLFARVTLCYHSVFGVSRPSTSPEKNSFSLFIRSISLGVAEKFKKLISCLVWSAWLMCPEMVSAGGECTALSPHRNLRSSWQHAWSSDRSARSTVWWGESTLKRCQTWFAAQKDTDE